MNKRKGISLIVLVITILVMIILAGVVVVSLQKNNPIEKAKEANFKTDISSFASELGVGLSNSLVGNSSVKPKEIFANKFVDMKKYINSFSKKYENKLVIADGKLTYIGGDSKEEKWSEECGIEVFRGANKPVLSEGMIPIKYENNSWVICSENDPSWYNYEQKLWANVMLSDGKYKDKNLVGTSVADGDLGSMFVWIPRFAYSIPEYKIYKNVEGNDKNIFDITTLVGKGNTDIEGNTYNYDYDSKTITQGVSTPKIVHPAFRFGDKNVSGIWTAKFESSMKEENNNTFLNNNTKEKTVMSVPDAVTWRYIDIGNMFDLCLEFSKNKNIIANSHLMRNTEWGAVAYFTASKYGKTPSINDNVDESNINETTTENVIALSSGGDYKGNISMSTTGNITGIYDMNGGAWEYVAAYFDNGNNSLNWYAPSVFVNGKLKSGYEKYFDKYLVSTDEIKACTDNLWGMDSSQNARRKSITKERFDLMKNIKGDAIYEITLENEYSYYGINGAGHYAWLMDISHPSSQHGKCVYNSDFALIGNTALTFIHRGGGWWNSGSSGIFANGALYGRGERYTTFRPVLICE